MIYDTLNNLPNYLGMSDNLDAVIEFVMARDINNLPAGKTRIDGEKAVVTSRAASCLKFRWASSPPPSPPTKPPT